MTKQNKNSEFDPEKDKEVKKGPLKPAHKNQYGEKHDENDRDLSKRAKDDDAEK